MNNIEQYQAIIFDLDDTLFPEIEFLKRVFHFISYEIIRIESDTIFNEKEIYNLMMNKFLLS